MKVPIEWVLIAAAVLIALGGFLIYAFGSARYSEGVSSCQNTQTTAAAAQDKTETKGRDAIDAKVLKTKITDVDIDGRKRGWVRD